MKAFASILKYSVTLVIGCLIIYSLNPIVTPLANFLNYMASPPTANVVTSRTVINSIKRIGKLITVTSEVHKESVYVSINQGFLNSESYSADHEAIGVIEAGIDFTKVKGDSFYCDDSSCTLILPAPGITHCQIVRFKQMDYSITILQADWQLVEELGRYESVEFFVKDVLEAGILDEAEEETELLLGEFVSDLTGKPVDIIFEEQNDKADLADTCEPEPPFGWKKARMGTGRE